ncbi:MAG: S9 family peptidase [Ignavibacteria bacterium]|jgi:dipeptidyl-peptidase-4|nr:S9 family peptidase [Ignavibacteria bacterium]
MKKAVLIILTAVILIPCSLFPQVKEITLEKIYMKYEFDPENAPEFKSMKDGNYYSAVGSDISINVYDYETRKKQRTLFSSEEYKKHFASGGITVSDYKLSPDERKILFTANVQKIYRHSTIADYYVWDIEQKSLEHINPGNKAVLAEFSPDGNMIAFVADNNISIYNSKTGITEKITSDGSKNKIINGSADWVYEEEISLTKAFEWSPDGKYLAYLKFDESNVKTFSLTFYEELYPAEFRYKYPKAGEDNSVVTVYVFEPGKNETRKIDLGSIEYEYIARLNFTPDSKNLALVCLDRLQKKLSIIYSNPEDGSSGIVFTETDKHYVNRNFSITFLSDGRFLRLSDADGYPHLYLHDKNGSIINQVTKGSFDVTELKGADEENNTLYYTALSQNGLNKDLFIINLDGSGKKQITYKDGFNDAAFSSGFKYYVSEFSDADTPELYELHRKDGTLVEVLEDNDDLADKMKEYGFVKKELFKFKTSEGIELNGWMMKPPSFNADKKYPVLVYVYGGPGSQSVQNDYGTYSYPWHQMMCREGYIIACVDGRGTAGKGCEFEKQIYGRMGELELKDQIEGAKYFASLPYVDKKRIGIWGWSFGGYMSALCITAGADYFKTAVAIAPVTNFRYYDNIYTERFLGLPSENPKGYDDNSPINHADKYKGNLLIVHGDVDDNVHVQNTMELVNALVKDNKQFEMQIYPNQNHNLRAGYTRYHLFKRMTEYLLRNL